MRSIENSRTKRCSPIGGLGHVVAAAPVAWLLNTGPRVPVSSIASANRHVASNSGDATCSVRSRVGVFTPGYRRGPEVLFEEVCCY
jgi:hypothetical protein